MCVCVCVRACVPVCVCVRARPPVRACVPPVCACGMILYVANNLHYQCCQKLILMPRLV